MINTSLKKRGAITLFIAVVLIMVSTLIIIFAANYGRTQQKATANVNRHQQAFLAAEAGLEYAINYLQQNANTILANPVSGYIQSFSNANVTNVVLANNSKFSIVYSNPVANNYNHILITSTGTSDDSTATRVVSQVVEFGSIIMNPPSAALVSKGNVSITGNATITNLTGATTIQAGGTVSMSGSTQTITSSGVSSTPGHIVSDVQAGNSALSSQSSNDFFATYFGVNSTTVLANMGNYFSSTSSRNYTSNLNGLTGTSIWIDQTGGSASLTGNATIGSSTNPVLLIVNGDLDISGNVTIYGFVFVLGSSSATTTVTGNISIVGGMISQYNYSMSGNTAVSTNASVLNNLRNQPSMRYYAKVPGTWKDY